MTPGAERKRLSRVRFDLGDRFLPLWINDSLRERLRLNGIDVERDKSIAAERLIDLLFRVLPMPSDDARGTTISPKRETVTEVQE